MRSSGYWLPWEDVASGGGDCSWELCEIDDVGRRAVDLLASRVSENGRRTKAQAAEALYRTIGYLCGDMSGGAGR